MIKKMYLKKKTIHKIFGITCFFSINNRYLKKFNILNEASIMTNS